MNVYSKEGFLNFKIIIYISGFSFWEVRIKIPFKSNHTEMLCLKNEALLHSSVHVVRYQ